MISWQLTRLLDYLVFSLGGVNGSGQVPEMIGQFGLIDPDTPQSAYTRTGAYQIGLVSVLSPHLIMCGSKITDCKIVNVVESLFLGLTGSNAGVEFELVWSDEFETDGRTFFPGDDPYWEAVDLH